MNDHDLCCFSCGESLQALSLPLSRRDLCPQCSAELHVCRMCVHFDRGVPGQCREDAAEDVTEKERANFCDWFKASEHAFDPSRKEEADAAADALQALFGDSDASGS